MSVEGCVAFFTVGVIYLYSNALVALFITTIISLIQLWFVLLWPESPKFLYSANRKKEANDSLKYIAKINSAKFKEIEIDEDVNNSNSANKNSSISLLEALKDRLYRKNILVMASVYWVSFMSYYVVGYYVGSFPGNLFINAFAVMTSDIIGSGLCSIWISFFGFKHGFSSLYIIVWISTIVYSFSNHELIISYIWVFMIRFGLTMAVALSLFTCSQLFDTKLQARSFAFWNFSGRVTSILSPLIVTLTKNPLSIVMIFSFAAMMVVQLLEKPK